MTRDDTSQPFKRQVADLEPMGPLFSGPLCYYLTSLVVIAGVWFANEELRRLKYPDELGVIKSMTNWDGRYYVEIASQGYRYEPDAMSSIAFFPAYPMLGAIVMKSTGLAADISLLIVSHVCLLAAFILMAVYVRERFPAESARFGDFVLIAMGLWPTTMFFRMAYSESLFLLLLVSAMWGMVRNWKPLPIALVIGLATACRPTGIALLAPLFLYLWQRAGSFWRGFGQGLWLLPVSCWGLLAFIAFQYAEFGEPLAFIKVQSNWPGRPPVSASERAVDLLTLEPVRAVFDRSSRVCWSHSEPKNIPIFNLQFANPIYFLTAGGLVILGAWRRWIDGRELWLSIVLLLIPYVTTAHRNGLVSMGRYAAVVFPVFIVLGHLAARIPLSVVVPLCGHCAVILCVYAALFVAWYMVI